MRTGLTKRGCLLGCSLLLAVYSYGQMQLTTDQYIQTYRGLAEEEEIRTGVPAAISLAQGIVETDSGNGWLVLHSNNHFGIKCKSTWTGETIHYDDDSKHECFRKYDNAVESWRDHSNFLRQNPRYAFLFQLDPRDYSDWALGLKKAGYATMPDYAQKLIRMIETYHLQQYTLAALSGDTSTSTPLYAAGPEPDNSSDSAPVSRLKPSRKHRMNTLASAGGHVQYPQGIFRINRRKVVYAMAGTSLPALARLYHVSMSHLRAYNELGQETVLQQGQLLYLQRKAKKGAQPTHEVRSGETMHSIAQVEGIQLSWLCHRNNLPANSVLSPGEVLVLRGFATGRTDVGSMPSQRHGLFGFVHRLFGKKELPQPVAAAQQPPASGTGEPAPAEPAHASGVSIQYDTTAPPPQENILIHKQQEPAKRTWPSDSLPAQAVHADTAVSAYHTVQKGDTLYNLSKRYGISISDLQAWNHLNGSDIHLGQQLRVSKP